jgi:hypothetical protein
MGLLARARAGFAQVIKTLLHGGRAPVTAKAGRYLGTRYPDGDVAAMAAEDGRARFSTPAWGLPNRVLHGLWAVIQAAVTHAVAVRLWLDGRLAQIAGSHARATQRFLARLAKAQVKQAAVARIAARRCALAEKLADRGLDPPTSAWPVLAFLGLLGLGDLTMTSVAMLVLNISDHPYVAWLPFSALQVAAVPVVFGMLAAAHFLGGSIKAYRCEQRLRPVTMTIGLVSLGGGLSLALSVAEIRSSYLAANGVPSLFWPFIGIQLGFFAVAVAASTWAAHPYRGEWRQVTHELRTTVRRYLAARRSVGRLAGRVNKLVSQQDSLVARAIAGVAAAGSDGARQGHLYLRGHQHGLPESVIEELYPGLMPQAETPGPVAELQQYPDVRQGSNLAPLAKAALDDLDDAWVKLLRQVQAAETAWLAAEPATPQLDTFPLNGAAQAHRENRGTPVKANGSARPGAK